MTDKKIRDTIKAREAEIDSVTSEFETRKAAFQKEQTAMQQFAAECQLKVTHLNGCIAELRRMLPKPKEKKKK